MVSPKRTRLDASTISVAQTVRPWLKAGLLEGYDGLLKEMADDMLFILRSSAGWKYIYETWLFIIEMRVLRFISLNDVI
jgi:hypothetical protein